MNLQYIKNKDEKAIRININKTHSNKWPNTTSEDDQRNG